jgi:hypothetical protein
MAKKILGLILPFFVIFSVILAACNFPGANGGGNNASQVQTLAAATIQGQVNQYLTQTAQAAPHVIIITATPQPTAIATAVPPTATATSIPPTATATAIPPTATAIPIPCNQAAFITDVTIPDGSSFVAGSSFVKTWRVRNTGSCAWDGGYSFIFLNGSSMSAPASVALPALVYPGQTVDISVPMIAPSNSGTFTGYWLLRASNGAQFGVGYNGGAPLSVVVVVTSVPAPKDPNVIYDFVKNYCSAEWRTNGAFITCPSPAINYSNGSITRSYAPVLENGSTDDEGAIITVPATGGDGMIQGQYPNVTIHSGDYFRSTVMCSYKKTACDVTFEVLAQEKGSSTITSLGKWNKTYNGSTMFINIDLSAMDGKKMIFYLKVYSNGNSTDDMAQWMAARITHD